MRRSSWKSLGCKLLLSYLVGIVTLMLAANLVAPTFFASAMDA